MQNRTLLILMLGSVILLAWSGMDYSSAEVSSVDLHIIDPEGDPDRDGLTNLEEYINSTDPLNFDTDGDLFPDGWEVKYDFNPRNKLEPGIQAYNDSDGDGLSDFDEMRYGTDPHNKHSDTDEVEDGVEAANGSDPANADDLGDPENCVQIDLTIGDHSGSHSERYALIVGSSTITHVAPEFGKPASHTYGFVEGEYPVRVQHLGTDPYYTGEPRPDYDYTAMIGGLTGPSTGVGFKYEDENNPSILGKHEESDYDYAQDKEGLLIVDKSIIKADFIDNEPNYSKKYDSSHLESDNFFLRETGDHEDLDIYYKIMPEGLEVSDVKINIYTGNTSEKIMVAGKDHLPGATNATTGAFKTGDNLHVQWTPDLFDQENDPGFYRLQLEVYVDGQTEPISQTSIDDADTSTPGWQCPQDGLAIHDLVWKHRPEIRVHASEDGFPVHPDHFMVSSSLMSVNPPQEIKLAPVVWSNLENNNEVDNYLDLFGDGDVSSAKLFSAERAVIFTSNRSSDNYIFLQYFMFENFSASPVDKNGVYHEGDLEYCQVAIKIKDLADGTAKDVWSVPFGMMAGQHYYGQTLRWNLQDGSAPASAQNQEHVENNNNLRPVVYIAYGAHATYFAEGSYGVVELTGTPEMGTQIQYSWPGLIHDETGNTPMGTYDLLHLDILTTYKSWLGRWGYTDDLGSMKAGPAGPALRAQKDADGNPVIILNNPRVLHNACVKNSQATEMAIP